MIELLPLPLFPGLPGGPELLVILLIVILLFGANKLPKLARASGEAIGEFQRGRSEIERELVTDDEDDEEDEDDEAAEADVDARADATDPDATESDATNAADEDVSKSPA